MSQAVVLMEIGHMLCGKTSAFGAGVELSCSNKIHRACCQINNDPFDTIWNLRAQYNEQPATKSIRSKT